MIPEAAWTLVPTILPPDPPMWVANAGRAAKLENREYLAYAWAMHLLSRLTNQAISTALTGLIAPGSFVRLAVDDISAGFIPYPGEGEQARTSERARRMSRSGRARQVDALSYSFGVVIGVSAATGERAIELADSPSQVVTVDDFPVVVELRRTIDHTPANPLGVASACYAQPLPNKLFFGPVWSAGIVIARHVLAPLGFAAGTMVPMSSGSAMPVVDIDAGASTIDAAIIDCGSLPDGVRALPLAPAIAPGTAVDIKAPGGTFAAQVLRINDHPSYHGNMVAHRVFFDAVGIVGDSGSLLVRRGAGDAVGIYMGSTGGTMPEGLAQSMRQVVRYFEVDLFA